MKLSDFTMRIMRKNTANVTDIPLTISSKDGLINQNDFFNKQVASKDMSGYYLLHRGEYAYNKSYSVGYDFGSIKRLEKYDMGALSTLYICFALTKFNSDFIKHYFDSLKWYREIYMISAEGARNHGLLNVPTEDFFATLHTLPTDEAEQEKIASFLDALTERIEKQRSLVENLKKYKRGLLDRVFNQNNGLYPSSWTEISIEDLFEPISDKNHPDETVLTIIQGQGTAPRDSIERRISYDKSSVKTYKLTDIGDFILHLRSFEGGLEKTNQKGIVSPAYTVLRPKLVVETGFYYAYFRSYWFINNKLRDSVEGIRDGKSINMISFWKIKIPLPSLEEQQRISHIFGLLDEKIQNSESHLIILQALKRTLLKQMFI